MMKMFHAFALAKLAVEQNQQYLIVKFPNILSISDAVDDMSKEETHIIAIYVEDNNTQGIPEKLEVKMPDGCVKTIATEIIKGQGKGKIHCSQKDSSVADINSQDYSGSICCAIRSTTNDKFLGIVTSAHIFTKGDYNVKNNGFLNPEQQTSVLINGIDSGNWYYKRLTYNQDLAIIKLKPNIELSDNFKTFNDKFHIVCDDDIKTNKPNVTIISRNNKNKIRDAYILDYGIGTDISYEDGTFYKKNIILIGTSNNRDDSEPISVGGDSGGCVFKKDTNHLIGIILGADEKFSLALPVHDTLHSKNFKTI
ncbi:MAG: trypsin-like serine protease [Bacteroidetes bacterium]|nr:trypsin-like serine protease [Bacteroidota bacterium]